MFCDITVVKAVHKTIKEYWANRLDRQQPRPWRRPECVLFGADVENMCGTQKQTHSGLWGKWVVKSRHRYEMGEHATIPNISAAASGPVWSTTLPVCLAFYFLSWKKVCPVEGENKCLALILSQCFFAVTSNDANTGRVYGLVAILLLIQHWRPVFISHWKLLQY